MRALLLAVSLVVLPTAVLAQAAIAGVVLDTSGAAVAGVVVEASSPELIEKLRTTISDESGRYRLENLRPGTYTVRFAHAGLSEIQRDGIELTGSFTATVDATLEIGPLSDTVTVTAETSPLDVHGAKRELTLSDEIRGLSSYVIPKIDVQVAATFQSKPGALLAANYAVPNALVVPSLGRNLSGNAPNVTVNLIAPGTMYGDRINELDFSVAKTLTYGRSWTRLAMEVYNLLNSSAVLTYNNTFISGGTWLQPLTVLTPRFFKITAEIEL